jgi:hypothetical protein
MDAFWEWARAYGLTQLVEVPIYLYAARKLRRRWLYAVGASTLTHPVLWFLLPWPEPPVAMRDYLAVCAWGESFVFVVEALWGWTLKVPSPWKWSFIANGASITAGMVMNAML